MLELFRNIALTDSHELREVVTRGRTFEQDRTDALPHGGLSSIVGGHGWHSHAWGDYHAGGCLGGSSRGGGCGQLETTRETGATG